MGHRVNNLKLRSLVKNLTHLRQFACCWDLLLQAALCGRPSSQLMEPNIACTGCGQVFTKQYIDKIRRFSGHLLKVENVFAVWSLTVLNLIPWAAISALIFPTVVSLSWKIDAASTASAPAWCENRRSLDSLTHER